MSQDKSEPLGNLFEMTQWAQRERWLAGDEQLVESFVKERPELADDQSVLIDLIYGEFCLREEMGRDPKPEEYQQRFPELREELDALFDYHREHGKSLSAEDAPASMYSANLAGSEGADHPDNSARPSTVDYSTGDSRRSNSAESPPEVPVGERRTSDRPGSVHSQVEEPPPRELPWQLGRYVLTERLGAGGMATVFKATDRRLEIPVAIKIPFQKYMSSPDHASLFLTEARALARLYHPNLCRIYDVGEIDDQAYLSMAFVEGRYLEHSPDADPREAADMVRTIALALAEAHAAGVIHRDLKPRNILVTPRGEPVVVDFGLALREMDLEKLRRERPDFAGTLAYMSPEQVQCKGRALGPATDVYSLGVILFQLLTGRLPFLGDVKSVTLQIRSLSIAARPPSGLRDDIDEALDKICLRALEKNIARRIPSMRDFANELEQYLARNTVRVATTVDRARIDIKFAPVSEVAPTAFAQQDYLYLDVGNRVVPAVIDHRGAEGRFGSTTAGVVQHAEFVRQAIKPWRAADAPFTVVLSEHPDLDTIAAAFAAIEVLATGKLPAGIEALAEHVDAVNAGQPGMSLENQYSLYAACHQLLHRLGSRVWEKRESMWRQLVREGMQVVSHVLASSVASAQPIGLVDAFNTQGLFGSMDRREVDADIERYERKLKDPACNARRCRLSLPAFEGARRETDVLFIENILSPDDPDRCVFFKDWVRTDRVRCPEFGGFPGLCLFEEEKGRAGLRCTISIRPDAGLSLEGLGKILEERENDGRCQMFSVDDRNFDPDTGMRRAPRPGYANADPWYDGRSHRFTIVGSPACASILSREEIERLIAEYGGRTSADFQSLS